MAILIAVSTASEPPEKKKSAAEIAGRELGELLGQLDSRRRRVGHRRGVGESGGLLGLCLGDLAAGHGRR